MTDAEADMVLGRLLEDVPEWAYMIGAVLWFFWKVAPLLCFFLLSRIYVLMKKNRTQTEKFRADLLAAVTSQSGGTGEKRVQIRTKKQDAGAVRYPVGQE